MAELYSIRCYFNTGFNALNRPADISVLNSASYQDFDSNYLWQNKDIATTRIKSTWNNICDCDYCRIGNMYYIVTGVSMQSGMTAELSLEVDPLLSIGGVSAIDRVSGWTERAHCASAEDGLFSNILSEPWAPSQPLTIDGVELIGPIPGQPLSIVLSTVKLTEIEHIAEVYETEAGAAIGGTVTIPKIPEASSKCTFGIDSNNFVYPAGSFYDYDAEGVKEAINDVRSLGIDSAIIAAYQIPENFTATQPTGALIGSLSNFGINVSPGESKLYRYGNVSVNNNKVYAMYNIYVLLSACSGDRAEWKAEDLYSGGDAPTFRHYADLSPTGRPYIQPTYFHGAETVMYQEAVKGEEWYRLPFSYTGVSGSLINETNRRRQFTGEIIDAATGAAEQVVNIADAVGPMGVNAVLNPAGVAGAAVNAAAFAVKTDMSMRENAILYQTKQNVVAPVIAFPQEYGAQAYLGNVFYLYRVRLSENDMVRADNFFTQFGYAQDKKFNISDLTNRSHFNFIKTRDADIINSSPLRLRQAAASVLNSGVRLWHILPNPAAMVYNP